MSESPHNRSCNAVEVSIAWWDVTGVRHLKVRGVAAGPGLAVHRALRPTFDARLYTLDRKWTITHVPSGRRVRGGFKTQRAALEAAQRFQRMRGVKWTEPFAGGDDPYTSKTWGPKGIKKRVERIVAKVAV